MNTLFEYTDRLKKPYECFIFDTALYELSALALFYGNHLYD
jgi:hypothetical protein